MRKKIVAGNWKMNMTPSQAVALVEELKPLVVSDDVEVVYCVPAIDIVPVVNAVKGTNVAVGAENMYFETKECYVRICYIDNIIWDYLGCYKGKSKTVISLFLKKNEYC